MWNYPQVRATIPHWWLADIGSGNGLLPSGNNPLSEPMLTKIYVTIWRYNGLTHWGWVTHICVGKLTIIGSDNGLSPGRRQAIIRTNAGILLIGTLGTNFSEILSEIHTFSFKKMHLKMSSGSWRPFCLGLNVLTHCGRVTHYGDGSMLCKNPIFFIMKEFPQI